MTHTLSESTIHSSFYVHCINTFATSHTHTCRYSRPSTFLFEGLSSKLIILIVPQSLLPSTFGLFSKILILIVPRSLLNNTFLRNLSFPYRYSFGFCNHHSHLPFSIHPDCNGRRTRDPRCLSVWFHFCSVYWFHQSLAILSSTKLH
jgi:hypothetical protein